MKQTMLLKLAPTEEQHHALLETMHAFNAGANYVAGVASAEKTANQFALQKLVYGELRSTYKLPAQLAIRAISKASEAYKREKSIKPTFRPEGALVYDQRVMAFKGLNTVSLTTLSGRVLVPFRVGGYQEARMGRIKGQADLLSRNGVFYLAVTLDMPEPPPQTPDGTLGIDLGIINLATDSEGESFSGEAVEKNRKRHHALRQRLQKRGTKSAKRHLKKLSGQEARFKRNTNHVISKRIVQKAKANGQGIAIEDLRHIRRRTDRSVRSLSVRAIPPGPLGNCVCSFPTRLLRLSCHCIRSILAIRLARVADVDTVRKRTASPKPLFVVCHVATPVTLIGTPLSISLGLPSCSLLHRDAPRCKPLGFSPRGS